MARVVKELNLEALTISRFYEYATNRALSEYRRMPESFQRELAEYLTLNK
ncbi:hypothetical protein MYX82_07725 [Acidobacteria bacterium AH-259-D05]|nr:hypothetical protein [Acidobacteria bacterium AH-259-D05]